MIIGNKLEHEERKQDGQKLRNCRCNFSRYSEIEKQHGQNPLRQLSDIRREKEMNEIGQNNSGMSSKKCMFWATTHKTGAHS